MEKKKLLIYGGVGVGVLVLLLLVMKKSPASTSTSTDPNGGQPIIIPAGGGSGYDSGNAAAMQSMNDNITKGFDSIQQIITGQQAAAAAIPAPVTAVVPAESAISRLTNADILTLITSLQVADPVAQVAQAAPVAPVAQAAPVRKSGETSAETSTRLYGYNNAEVEAARHGGETRTQARERLELPAEKIDYNKIRAAQITPSGKTQAFRDAAYERYKASGYTDDQARLDSGPT